MNRIIIISLFSFILLLSGCSFGTSTESSLNDVLSKVYEDEEGYRTAQEQLSELEKNEQTSFKEMMELTQEQKEELSAKVSEMETSLEERLKLISAEEESINQAEETFKEIDGVIEQAEEEDVKGILQDMKAEMTERFSMHEEFIKQYEQLSELQRSLYAMLADNQTEMPALQNKVKEVNVQNDAVQKVIAQFNEHTKIFNDLKNEVYEKFNGEKNE
ncbi:YkyA family protein [Chungangia koreensis]|uniref:YkyA family protein n=1 Tax=Chungangia koreensis TaxID=752657 RepID=A0ABV8X1Z2_9LACT